MERMCNDDIHYNMHEDDGLLNCPFCDETIGDFQPERKYKKCCENMKVIKSMDDETVCIKCGQMFPYDYVNPFIDYENRHLYHKKSYYIRKYHIENVIWKLTKTNGLDISYQNNKKIFRILELLNDSPDLTSQRKKLISMNYLIRFCLKLLGDKKNSSKIPITKNKRTLRYYVEFVNRF